MRSQGRRSPSWQRRNFGLRASFDSFYKRTLNSWTLPKARATRRDIPLGRATRRFFFLLFSCLSDRLAGKMAMVALDQKMRDLRNRRAEAAEQIKKDRAELQEVTALLSLVEAQFARIFPTNGGGGATRNEALLEHATNAFQTGIAEHRKLNDQVRDAKDDSQRAGARCFKSFVRSQATMPSVALTARLDRFYDSTLPVAQSLSIPTSNSSSPAAAATPRRPPSSLASPRYRPGTAQTQPRPTAAVATPRLSTPRITSR